MELCLIFKNLRQRGNNDQVQPYASKCGACSNCCRTNPTNRNGDLGMNGGPRLAVEIGRSRVLYWYFAVCGWRLWTGLIDTIGRLEDKLQMAVLSFAVIPRLPIKYRILPSPR